MWRIAATVLVLWALGCGEDAPEREVARPEPTPTADDPRAPAGPCPEGTPFVRARDVIGPLPDDYRVARATSRRSVR